jgi:hypothetical protein
MSTIAAFPKTGRPDELDRLAIDSILRALYGTLDEIGDRVGDQYADRVAEYCVSAMSGALKLRRGRRRTKPVHLSAK